MITTDKEKLYSPLEFYLHEPREEERSGEYGTYDLFDERYKVSHYTAADHLDNIELAIRRDRDRMHPTQGLAEYIPDQLRGKVKSLFPSIEQRALELYCVATVELKAPLTIDETGTLKDWWRGQLSDGWGEGFGQREIKYGDYELYVVPWHSGNDFFIDTEQEFQNRRKVKSLTPEEVEKAFITNADDAYAVYRFEGYLDSSGAFSRSNYRIGETALLTDNDTLDTIKAKHALEPSSVIALKQNGEITAWYVDALAFSKLPEFYSDLELNSEQTLSPAQMALDEPGIFDEDIDCIDTSAYMSMLTDRVNANYIDYIDSLRGIDGESITDYSAELATISEAHYYITNRHNFHFSELDYLLQFKNPLLVVTEAFDANRDEEHSDIMWKIFHEQDALKSGRHPFEHDTHDEPGTSNAEALKQQLSDRLDKNLTDFRQNMMGKSKQYIYDMADEIATRYAACEYMKTAYDFKTGEVEFLLQFQDPLSFVADRWPSTLDGIANLNDEISGILADRSSHGHYALVMDETNPAAKESAKGQSGAEKHSVIEQIRAAEKEPKQPRKEKSDHKRNRDDRER